MWGLVVVFGIYYAPYVYMFTASALRNMDPSLEEAAEISGASAFAHLFTVTFPLIMPAIISGMLLSFIVMLGIYGIPAVLGAPTISACSRPTSSSSPTGRRRSTPPRPRSRSS